jgi:hypothetical protein
MPRKGYKQTKEHVAKARKVKLANGAPRQILYCINCGEPREYYVSALKDPQQWFGKSDTGEILYYRCRKCHQKMVIGISRPKEVCEKISKSKQGTVFSKDHIRKLSEAHMGKKPWNDGVPCKEETKRKISGTLEGRILSEEVKQNMSKGMAEALHKIGRKNGYKSGWFVSNKFGTESFYRSSFEKQALELFEQMDIVVFLKSESCVLPYRKGNVIRHYVVDYHLQLDSGEEFLIEVKPFVMVDLPDNLLKFQAAEDYAEKNGMFFCILTENELTNVNSVETKLMEVISSAMVATHQG